MNKKRFNVLFCNNKDVASFYVTTTGAQTLTLALLTVDTGKTLTINWGDGTSTDYTGTGARTHDYAAAGTYKVNLLQPKTITYLTIGDAKVTINSSDIKSLSNIYSLQINAVKSTRFRSSDLINLRPTIFALYSFAAGADVTFNSVDVANWRPATFQLYSMPAGVLGTFNSSDISAWTPSNFALFSMPANYAGTMQTSHISAWNPTFFQVYSMPVSYTFTFSVNGFDTWKAPTTFRLDGNALITATVDQILSELWTAFATRTAAGGTINVGGTNQAPSGVYQAANPPTTGLEYRYELLNDSQNINPTKKWATVTVTA